jgi:SNF2 family DNA or RNA helicase
LPELYDFQKVTVHQWSPKEYGDERSSLLGDDMGTGKTVQSIALDLKRRIHHNCMFTAQTLIVTRMSVMGAVGEEGGWVGHYHDWAPQLNVFVIDPKNRQAFVDALKAKDARGFPKYHVFIAHWQVLRFIEKELREISWFMLVGDEIQAIKNRKAQVTRAFKLLRPYYKLGASGTWADNKPPDAWSILNWLWPKVFTAYHAFDDYHTIYAQKEKKDGTKYKVIVGVHDVASMHANMGPGGKGYIRRTKEQVIKDLPEKYHTTVHVDLAPQQRRAYDEMERNMLAWVGQHENEPIAAPVVIAKLIRLQQFAVAYGRLERVFKTVQNKDYPRCPQNCHRQFEDGHKPHRYLLDADGEVIRRPADVLRLDDPSSKLDAVMDLLEETNDQVVIFGQSKQAMELLRRRLQDADIPSGILVGDTSAQDRTKLVSEFQQKRLRVIAGTIQTGGVGITLTSASKVIFLDLAWKPSDNKQAEDRLHRLGQKNAVQVITLVARGTLDARRNRTIAMKWEWLKEVLGDKTVEDKRKELYKEN